MLGRAKDPVPTLKGMSHKDRSTTTLSGMVTPGYQYRPGKFLRFTLAGSTIHPVQRERELIYYQDVIIPGARADAVMQMLKPHHSYLVEGNLVSSTEPGEGGERGPGQTHWRVMAFSVVPIHRKATQESATGHKRLEDAMSHALVIGNLMRDPQVIRNEHGVIARAVIGVSEGPRGGRTQTSRINIKIDEPELAESLGEAQRGDRLLAMGPLITERYTMRGQQIRQSTVLAYGIEYIGRLDDEDAPAPESAPTDAPAGPGAPQEG